MRSLLRPPILKVKIKKNPGYGFIVELYLLIKGHNPVKEKANFAIFFV